MIPCPECENKKHLSAMEMTPELVAEMAAAEPVTDYAGDSLVEKKARGVWKVPGAYRRHDLP